MAKEKSVEEIQNENTSIVVAEPSPMVEQQNMSEMPALPAQFLAELNAEIQADLKTLTVDQVTSARSLLLGDEKEPNRTSDYYSLHDAFLMQFVGFADEKKNDDGTRVVLEITDKEGIEIRVAQNPIGSRLTLVNIFTNVKKAQQKLLLTNMQFREVGKEKYGNQSIVFVPSPETQQLFNQ